MRGGSPPVNVMYLFLLAFGAMLSLAGVILAASGLSIHDHTFDTGVMTAGIVAVVGGLLLIGLGVALRVLQRIEQALEMRPSMPREATLDPVAAGTVETPAETARSAFPVRISRSAQTTADVSEPATFAEKHTEEVPLKFPKVARAGPVTEDIEPAKPPLSATAHDAEERPRETAGALFSRALRGRNGAAPAPRLSPRLDASARAPLSTQRPTGPAFDALWPKGSRRGARAQTAAAPELSATVHQRSVPERATPEVVRDPMAQEPAARERVAQEGVEEPAVHEAAVSAPARERAVTALPGIAPDARPEDAPEPVTVLKSGIVDGMAYTLYSDGSIEAQLPQGMLRFGSISDLRAHIEQDTQSS